MGSKAGTPLESYLRVGERNFKQIFPADDWVELVRMRSGWNVLQNVLAKNYLPGTTISHTGNTTLSNQQGVRYIPIAIDLTWQWKSSLENTEYYMKGTSFQILGTSSPTSSTASTLSTMTTTTTTTTTRTTTSALSDSSSNPTSEPLSTTSNNASIASSDSRSSPSAGMSPGVIAGIVVGGIALFALFALLWRFIRKRRRGKASEVTSGHSQTARSVPFIPAFTVPASTSPTNGLLYSHPSYQQQQRNVDWYGRHNPSQSVQVGESQWSLNNHNSSVPQYYSETSNSSSPPAGGADQQYAPWATEARVQMQSPPPEYMIPNGAAAPAPSQPVKATPTLAKLL
ncbi:hypothetical protein FRC17_010424 [Serendipita sp. 399]|nr:hypothetical protein FRC17_010424 [Serendipita sp. 399]